MTHFGKDTEAAYKSPKNTVQIDFCVVVRGSGMRRSDRAPIGAACYK